MILAAADDAAFTTKSKRKGLVFKGFLQYLHDIYWFYGIVSSFLFHSLSTFILFLSFSPIHSCSHTHILHRSEFCRVTKVKVFTAYIRIQYIYIYIYIYIILLFIYVYYIHKMCFTVCSRERVPVYACLCMCNTCVYVCVCMCMCIHISPNRL